MADTAEIASGDVLQGITVCDGRNTVRFEKPTFAPTATAPEAPTAPTTPPQPEKDVLDAAEDYLFAR